MNRRKRCKNQFKISNCSFNRRILWFDAICMGYSIESAFIFHYFAIFSLWFSAINTKAESKILNEDIAVHHNYSRFLSLHFTLKVIIRIEIALKVWLCAFHNIPIHVYHDAEHLSAIPLRIEIRKSLFPTVSLFCLVFFSFFFRLPNVV